MTSGSARRHDSLTVVAVSILAYGIANILHEGVGHGGACLLVGGKPELLTSVSFASATEHLPRSATRWIQAGGTLTNFAAAALTLALAPLAARASANVRYFLWLFATVNLLQATGYFLFSGVAGIGDWAALTRDLTPVWAPRVALVIAGGIGYWMTIKLSLRRLEPFLSGDPARRISEAVFLTVVPYLTGGVFYTLSGIWNPHGILIVFISAIAASFGGTSGLAWCAQLLRGQPAPSTPREDGTITRGWGFIAVAAVLAIFFTVVLGPGVRLS